MNVHPLLVALFLLFALALLAWAIARFRLQGPDLSMFDRPAGRCLSPPGPASDAHRAVVASLGGAARLLDGVPRSRHVAVLRQYIDTLFPDDAQGVSVTPADAGGVRAEWVLAPGADPARRLLYIHGGAFIMGSPRSHRRLTSRFSEISGAAVLAIDYRLMPEHPRIAGIQDCRSAYGWMLDNGPQGAGPAARVYVAGDSAGGNLTLSLLAWIRDHGLRAPDAAVALSPLTDATMGSPSLKQNRPTDPMLGPFFGALAKIPHSLLLWGAWLQTRIRPSDPLVSPVYGNLAGLPPLLIQSSEAEMLHDDARRYANKAAAAGSPVTLQTWTHMVHVWQIFHPDLPEGREAFEEIRSFLATH
ncbi:alpha/beta hydrolase [Quisquiliibacterium transsilvanicum]|jgi:acetyl esterase/lipase|uniref:Acetyl esterase/lipase n=1 Tax=Quisquiliibacterium transsilvanicum TaxID=1549638 RepID=A0A7W8M819_9BURK|nr:alpha/beta hydrolase [Quisquiliibacterium transsilvanicum]MBB5271167.1 acetyl esterase/lipase [Quisquiliibacterium transsilvanicum]